MDRNTIEFTEDSYRRLIKLAKDKYKFIDYTNYLSQEKVVLWRHDVDSSVQRAYALAKIEREEGIRSTYFIHLQSKFYNPFEKDSFNLIKGIKNMGHDIGIHFDCEVYNDSIIDQQRLQSNLMTHKDVFRQIFGIEVRAFSFHNPTNWILQNFQDELYGGLVNTYSFYIRDHFGYCSDSNGYWRFESLEDVLLKSEYDRLQILTHPEWWQKVDMTPRKRIQRCIDGRALATANYYDQKLHDSNRINK